MKKSLFALTLAAASFASHGGTVVPGLTFGYEYDGGSYDQLYVGSAVSIGANGSEGQYGFSEFDLAGLAGGAHAVVSFTLVSQSGYVALNNEFNVRPLASDFYIGAYVGDNKAAAPSNYPYQPMDFGTSVATLSSGGAPDPQAELYGDNALRSTLDVGQTFSVDVSDIFNADVASGVPSLGIAVRGIAYLSPLTGSIYEFGNFALTVTPVPEPSTCAMMLAGLGIIGWAGRQRRKK